MVSFHNFDMFNQIVVEIYRTNRKSLNEEFFKAYILLDDLCSRWGRQRNSFGFGSISKFVSPT